MKIPLHLYTAFFLACFQQLCGVARCGKALAMFHLRPGCLSAGNEMSTVHSLCSESGSSAGRVLPKDQCWGLVTKGNSVKRPKVLALGYVIRSQERQED